VAKPDGLPVQGAGGKLEGQARRRENRYRVLKRLCSAFSQETVPREANSIAGGCPPQSAALQVAAA
jgi:hypothetical protein